MSHGEHEKSAKTEHTPEPWSYGEDNDGWYVGKNGFQIAHGLTEEDARRITSCVNACAGVDVAWLESMAKAGGFATMNQYIAAYNQAAAAINYEKQRDELLSKLDKLEGRCDALKQQRDDLLAACNEAIDCGEDGDWQSAFRILHDAITSVKEK